MSGLVVAVVLGGSVATTVEPKNNAPSPSYATPTYGTQSCQKKRVDACGCHHVYGVRHCHPNRRSAHCESLAQTETTADAFVAFLADQAD